MWVGLLALLPLVLLMLTGLYLFSSLEGNTRRRAIDIHKSDKINGKAL